MRKYFWITILIIASVVILLPIIRQGMLVTDDQDWMVIRLSAFYQSLREGQFPVRHLGRLNFSYGYPVSNFQYPALLYIGSFLHGIGISFQNSIETIMVGFVVIGALAIFLWLRRFFDERASAIGAISYLLMPYLQYDLFKRGSVGEVVAMNTCLVVLYAIESKRIWLMVPAVFLLAIAHNTLALFLIPVLLGYIAVKRYWSLVIPFILGVGMSSFFWLPIFFELHLVLFDDIIVSDPLKYFPVSGTIFLQSLPFIASLLFTVFSSTKKAMRYKEQWYFFGLIAVSSVMASGVSSIVWQNQSFARFIQFPFRFYALWCFAGPWFVAAFASNTKYIWRVALSGFIVLVLFALSIPYQFSESIVREEGFFTTNESTTTVANENMPRWVNKLPTQRAPTRLEVVSGNTQVEISRMSTSIIDIVLHAKEESILQINSIYYPGWGALLDNKPLQIAYDNPMGLMHVSIPTGDHHLYMAFRETTTRFIADSLSVIFFVIYFVVYIIPLSVRKKAL